MAADTVSHGHSLKFVVETEAIVRCTGRITSNTGELLKAIVKPLIEDNRRIVLDLSEVDYMDSGGLGAIAGLFVSGRAKDCRLSLVNFNQRVKDLLTITKLGEVLTETVR